MTMKQEVFNLLKGLALGLGDSTTTPERLRILTEALVDTAQLSLPEIKTACAQLLLESHRYIPSPHAFIKAVRPHAAISDEDLANAMAGKIIAMIREYGWTQPQKAQEVLGDKAWMAVIQFGGWDVLCTTPLENIGTARAQLRDLCRSLLKTGGDYRAVQERLGQTSGMKPLDQAFKLITSPKEKT